MKIETADLKVLAARTSQYPEDNLPEFLLVGRSNVGKSSFINTLVQKKNLAHTSATPGKTQTLNFYIVNNRFYLVDAPGYGYAQVNKETQKKFGLMIEEYLINRTNLKRVFLLVDFRHKPTEDDLLMYNFMKYYNLDVTIIATKFDKVKQKEKDKNEKIFRESFDLREGDNIVLFSSITKKGREEIYSLIENIIDTKM
ncbi:MAG: YihA family ribosome biogenesis GTP-binding protein [Bacilli bacterium]|nr:YihA family ribosome biogenesis GTP-binding protein [Bacilli bacterium]